MRARVHARAHARGRHASRGAMFWTLLLPLVESVHAQPRAIGSVPLLFLLEADHVQKETRSK
jgi:hypothetical protein